MRLARAVLLTVLAAGCSRVVRTPASPFPETAAAEAWARLDSTSSFAFHLRYHTDTPFPLAADLAGTRRRPDREAWNGWVERGGETSRVELAGSGVSQYERDGSRWLAGVRGLETRVLDQARQALRQGSVTYLRSDRGRFIYAFDPVMPVLDPTETKHLSGTWELDRRSGLPLRAYVTDSARSAEWELSFGRYNRAGPVAMPFVPAWTFRARPEGRAGCSQFRAAAATVRARLEELGWDYRLRRDGADLVLDLAQDRPAAEIEPLLGRGEVRLWRVGWLPETSNATDTARVKAVGRDAARRVVLDSPVASNPGLRAEPDLALPVQPVLVVRAAGLEPGADYALVADGSAVDAAPAEPDGTLRFAGIGNETAVRVLAALVNHHPLPVRFIVSDRTHH